MDWYLGVFKKYAVFSGRARRTEFWMFALFNFLASIVLSIVDGIVGSGGVLGSLYGLAVFVPSLAVGVRRLHDTNRSGWWWFIGLIPLVGWIILLIFFATEGQPGENQYGPSPKLASAGGPVAASVPAGWYKDPTGRHEMRYWDSSVWTSHVSDAGVASTDPVQP